MGQIKWFDRKFSFDTQQNIFPAIFEWLAGTSLRLEDKVNRIDPSILQLRINGTWSIKENIGHLTDLEGLWQTRLTEIKEGNSELRAADLQNVQTHSANHNDKSINELLSSFRNARQLTLNLLEGIDDELIFKSALHPRLKTPMRTMDLFIFVAEHDDHHLARITELEKFFKKTN